MNQKGFTMVEMTIAVVILAVAILGLATSTSRLTRVAMDAENKALALQAVEDRMAHIRLHPIYTQLDTVFTESGTDVPGLDGYTRDTEITRILQSGAEDGKYIDYTRITVTVDGPGLENPVSRTVSIGN
jgi:prepilin-type N-terminal cleavage/methylation domain-containing protein